MALPPKGTMRPLKLIVGIFLALYVITSFYQLDLVASILEIPYLQTIVMGIAAYFLIVTGRQL